ncbi:uncharacterized protein LOC111086979 [Limulus polyphemus]|uniref:Uncharacterized protein LOC111086979 n=1 Tax=Limulus polyphemus TaxID=6850 RepID=A0ABM1SVM4_LIMPO|nr:uncharacterized protein LOC111086979 [Limulus polyphemus]
MECISFLVATLEQIKEKCPLSYSLPGNQYSCRTKFKKVVDVLCSTKKVKENDSDEIVKEYSNFLENIPCVASEKFTAFSVNNDRVDELLAGLLKDDENYAKFWNAVQILVLLSHGQADVEDGFSVNKEVEVENLHEQLLVTQRLVCDYVVKEGGVTKVPITNALPISAVMSRQKYNIYLETEREKMKTEAQQRKRKNVLEEIEAIKKKKLRLNQDILSLTKSADDLAEKTGNLILVVKEEVQRKNNRN